MLKIRTESASAGMSGAIGVGPDYYNNQKMKLVIEGTANELAGLEISIPGQPDENSSALKTQHMPTFVYHYDDWGCSIEQVCDNQA